MKPRSPALAFALMFAAALLCWALPAQQAPPPQKQEPPQTDAQLGPLGDALKQKAAEKAIGSLLDSQLPLKLDAKTLYPTVSVLPGGPFAPRPLVLSPASLNRPLPPGDYTLPVFAFCTEYSVHRPGTGVAYELAPMQGKAAHAIWALLWRGTIEKRRPPAHLLAVSWAIQSGITYARMPRTYQAVVDDVIPEYRGQLNGDFMQNLEDVYQSYARGAHLPPLEQLLARMGKAGELALAARRQRQILLAQNVNDERKTQTLFVGQESGVYRPVKAEEGPWTERIPGVAYMRFRVVGGHMAGNNVLEIRILPKSAVRAAASLGPRITNARLVAETSPQSYQEPCPQVASADPGRFAYAGYPPATLEPCPQQLLTDTISHSVGAGAQALIPVPLPPNPDPCSPIDFSNPPNPAKRDPLPPGAACNHIGVASDAFPDTSSPNYSPSQPAIVWTHFCLGKSLDAIRFKMLCPDPRSAHIIQFITRERCNDPDCNSVVSQPYGYGKGMFDPSLPRNPKDPNAVNCALGRQYTTDPGQPNWYLDANDLQSPYLLPAGSPPGETADEPNVDLGPPYDYTVRANFVDFVLCGQTVTGVIFWNRTKVKDQPPTYQVINPNPAQRQQILQQVCGSINMPNYLINGVPVRQILGCP